MVWEHVEKLLDEEVWELGLKRTKLTYDHIHLTPQNKMRVYLAAQVNIVTKCDSVCNIMI